VIVEFTSFYNTQGLFNQPREFYDSFVFFGERGAATGAEAVGISGRLFILSTALAALNFGQESHLLFDDFARLVVSGLYPSQGAATPGTKIIRLELSFRQREQASLAESHFSFTNLQIGEHFSSKGKQDSPDFFSWVTHAEKL
jgi:hypothetical protein